MKIFVQIVDTHTGIYQTGMIDEPVMEGMETLNALKHFGVSSVEFNYEGEFGKVGIIPDTSKVVTIIQIK